MKEQKMKNRSFLHIQHTCHNLPVSVILSAAKDLNSSLTRHGKPEILRCAQDDM